MMENDYGEVKCARVSCRVEKVNGVYDAARERYVFRLQNVRSHFGVYFTEHELFSKVCHTDVSATYLRCEVI